MSFRVPAQTIPDKNAENTKREAALRAAKQFAETAIAESKELRLDENHILIESNAADVFWQIDPQQARALLHNVLVRLRDEEFLEGAGDDSVRQRRLALRQRVLESIASHDPQLMLDNLGKGNRDKEKRQATEMSQYRRDLELGLASRVALQEPHRAIKLAEENLGDDISYRYAEIVSTVWQKDAPAAAKLAQEVISAFRRAPAQARPQNLYSAVNLLSVLAQLDLAETQQPAGQRGSPRPLLTASLHQLADFVAAEALGSENQSSVLSNLSYSVDQFEKYAPAKFALVKERIAQWKRQNPQVASQEEFNRISATASLDEQLDFAAKAPPQNQDSFYQQIASTVSQKGDVEQARQIILRNVPESANRSQMLRDIAQQASWQAASKGDFELARSYAVEGVHASDERAMLLAQLVGSAGDRLSKANAFIILEEASSLLSSPPQTANELSASLQVAGAFARFDSRRSAEILEAAAERINEVLNGLSMLDGFLPYSRSFEAGELLLENGYASSSLVGPYSQAAAGVAREDPTIAVAFAQKLQRPEARAQVYLGMARELAYSAGGGRGSGTIGLSSYHRGFGFAIR